MKIKYRPMKFWCFAWGNGKPNPFLMPHISSWHRRDAIVAALKHFGNQDGSWEELRKRGGRIVHCTAIPVIQEYKIKHARREP